MSIIVEGNPVDGFVFHGPFEDSDAAVEWATNNPLGDWWLANLQDVD